MMKTEPAEEAVGEASEHEGATSRREEEKHIIGISILGLVLRVFAAIGTLGSAVAMGTTNQTLPFSFLSFQFRAQYNDLPTCTFFVVVNSVVCVYLVLSLPLSLFNIIRSATKITGIILLVFDTVMVVLLACGASAATSIVYLAHKGNANANWFPICRQFSNFCQRISTSLIGSFISIIMFMLIIITSAVSPS